MVSEAGVPELARHEIPRKLLQPLTARYETALSQLEKTVKVRASTSSASALVMPSHRKGRQAGSSLRPWETPPLPWCLLSAVVGRGAAASSKDENGAKLPFLPQEEQKLKAA